VPGRHERVLQVGAARVVGVDVAGGDHRQPRLPGQLAQVAHQRPVAAQQRSLQLNVHGVRVEPLPQPGEPRERLRAAAVAHQPRHQAVPRAAGEAHQALRVGTQGGRRQRRSRVSRVPAWAMVMSRHRFAYPRWVAANSVRWLPSVRVTSQPVMGRSPAPRAAWANASEPHSPSWSVSAIARCPSDAAVSASSSGLEAPSRKLKAEWAWSST